MKKFWFVLGIITLAVVCVFSDTIELKSGDLLSGKISTYDAKQTTLQTKYGIMTIPNSDIRKIIIEPTVEGSISSGIPRKGLVIELLMNGSSQDTSGNGNNVQSSFVSPTTNRFGKTNQALHFNGSSSEIKIENKIVDWTEGFAISVWAQKTGNGDRAPDSTIIMKAANSNGKDEFRIWSRDSNNSTIGIWSKTMNNTFQAESTSIMTGWTFIVAQIANGNLEVYINGKLENASPYSGIMLSTNSTIRVGNSNWYNGDYRWEGDIDNLRVYNRSLTVQEINNLYMENE